MFALQLARLICRRKPTPLIHKIPTAVIAVICSFLAKEDVVLHKVSAHFKTMFALHPLPDPAPAIMFHQENWDYNQWNEFPAFRHTSISFLRSAQMDIQVKRIKNLPSMLRELKLSFVPSENSETCLKGVKSLKKLTFFEGDSVDRFVSWAEVIEFIRPVQSTLEELYLVYHNEPEDGHISLSFPRMKHLTQHVDTPLPYLPAKIETLTLKQIFANGTVVPVMGDNKSLHVNVLTAVCRFTRDPLVFRLAEGFTAGEVHLRFTDENFTRPLKNGLHYEDALRATQSVCFMEWLDSEKRITLDVVAGIFQVVDNAFAETEKRSDAISRLYRCLGFKDENHMAQYTA